MIGGARTISAVRAPLMSIQVAAHFNGRCADL